MIYPKEAKKYLNSYSPYSIFCAYQDLSKLDFDEWEDKLIHIVNNAENLKKLMEGNWKLKSWDFWDWRKNIVPQHSFEVDFIPKFHVYDDIKKETIDGFIKDDLKTICLNGSCVFLYELLCGLIEIDNSKKRQFSIQIGYSFNIISFVNNGDYMFFFRQIEEYLKNP